MPTATQNSERNGGIFVILGWFRRASSVVPSADVRRVALRINRGTYIVGP